MTRAVVENGVVINTVVAADGDPSSVAIPEGQPVGIGWLYDGSVFTPPSPAPSYRKYGFAEFIDALTADEAVDFVTAKAAEPRLEVWVELARARGIDFSDAATRAAAPLLVTLGVLTQARLDELIGE